MKQLKITFLLVTITLLAMTSAFAQGNSKKEIAIQKRLDEINEVYKLTERQKGLVRKFIEQHVDKQEELKSLEVSSFWELKNAYGKVSSELHDSVKSVLTYKQIRSQSALFYYPHFKVKSHKKVCVRESGNEMRNLEAEMYGNEIMLPTLITQRKKLDNKINPNDKKRIGKLRQELVEAEKAVDDFRKMNHYGFISAVGLSDRQSAAYGKLTSTANYKREEITNLTKKYNTDIDILLKEIEPSMNTWKTELEAIDVKYFPTSKERQSKWTEEKRAKVEQSKMNQFKFKFLILDYDADYSYQNKMTVDASYFGSSNTINLELKQAGDITLELLDKDGKSLQTVLSEHREAGLHILNIDILDLENGSYKYLLKTSDNEEILVPVGIFKR